MTRDLFELLEPVAGEGVARFYGVVSAIVTTNEDPDQLGRVKLRFPWLAGEGVAESWWARVAAPMAGAQYGVFFLPEVDDEVLVAFEHGDMRFPYVIGALWNGNAAPPETNSDGENNPRTIKSRSGHILRFDDKDGAEKIEIVDSSGANSIVIDTAANTITITADADITIESTGGKLVLKGSGVEITSQAEVKIEASSDVDVDAGGTLNVKGSTVNIN